MKGYRSAARKKSAPVGPVVARSRPSFRKPTSPDTTVSTAHSYRSASSAQPAPASAVKGHADAPAKVPARVPVAPSPAHGYRRTAPAVPVTIGYRKKSSAVAVTALAKQETARSGYTRSKAPVLLPARAKKTRTRTQVTPPDQDQDRNTEESDELDELVTQDQPFSFWRALAWPFVATFRRFPIASIFILTLSSFLLLGTWATYHYIFENLPPVEELTGRPLAASSSIVDRNGELLYTLYDDENRTIDVGRELTAGGLATSAIDLLTVWQ